ncbi:MAG: HAMP domain-containing protein [Oscillospiraceae bacterium]|nr:HAMP domain-containing protein [Oscillospiraceae bacterium]
MLKRIAAGIVTAVVFPLIYLFFVKPGDIPKRSDSIADDLGNSYTLFYDIDELIFIKSDSEGEIVGKWKTARVNGYNYMSVDAMNVFDGEFYCVLAEIDSKDFIMCGRQWLKIDFERDSAEVIAQKKYGNIQNAYSTVLTVSDGEILTVTAHAEGNITVTDMYGQIKCDITPPTKAAVNYASILSDGKIIYSDVLNRIYITDENGNPRQVYEADTAGSFYGLYLNDDGFCIIRDTCTNEYLISSDNIYSGQISFMSADMLESPQGISAYRDDFDGMFFMYCAAGAAAGIILFALLSLKRFPVLLKIVVILILCLGIGGVALFALTDSIMERIHLESSLERSFMSAKLIEAKIDLDRLENMDWNNPEESGYFYELADIMEYIVENDRIMPDNGSPIDFDDKDYCWIFPVSNGRLRSGICDQFPVNLPFEKVVEEKLINKYKQVAEGKIGSVACGTSDDSSEWVIAIYPLKNDDGEVVALIEAGISKLNYMTTSRQYLSDILLIVSVFEAITGALILAATGITLHPLKKLHKAVEATGNGDYGVSVELKGRDEIAGIAKAFNVMSAKIYDHTQSLSRLNEAYLRFLPSGIISAIGKPSVISVSRGDYSSMRGYILHIQLMNFSEQTADLSEDDVFELTNNISRQIMDSIMEKSGVIESYNQEEYICIFNEADLAYSASVNLIQRLRCDYPGIKTSFVIVSDSMLLGIVGHEKRLGTIMLSRGIRLSKKLGKIASLCGANLIVTSDVSFSAPCPQRLLGKIDFDGREYTFCDCFGGDEISVYLSKLEGCAQFEEMVEQFYDNQWHKCRRSALLYLERNKNDSAAIRYLFLCENNIKNSAEKSDMESIILQ